VDSDTSFVPDLKAMACFLPCLTSLSAEQRDLLEAPLTFGEFSDAVKQAASCRSPWSDGLS
jgi:hypothetical protein